MKPYIALVCFLPLLSCASNQAFDCPYNSGIRCQPLREIDASINRHDPLKIWLAPNERGNGLYQMPGRLQLYP